MRSSYSSADPSQQAVHHQDRQKGHLVSRSVNQFFTFDTGIICDPARWHIAEVFNHNRVSCSFVSFTDKRKAITVFLQYPNRLVGTSAVDDQVLEIRHLLPQNVFQGGPDELP
jgi:hypothetical protein